MLFRCSMISIFKYLQVLVYFYFFYSIVFFIHVFSIYGLVYLLIQPLAMYIVLLFGSSSLTWICALFFLVSNRFYPFNELKELAVEDSDSSTEYLLSVTRFQINIYSNNKKWNLHIAFLVVGLIQDAWVFHSTTFGEMCLAI